MKNTIIAIVVLFALVLGACAPQATPTPEPAAPTTAPKPTATPEPVVEAPAPQSIVDIAVADGRFTTLVTAVTAAGLAETLSGEGNFTVFAPTDEAFAALPEGTIEALLADIPTLTNILLYHVVDATVLAEEVVGLNNATTLAGLDVTIRVDMGKVYINDAEVIITDIVASNGVIHVIDTVLIPNS